MWHAGRMAQIVCPWVSAADRARLEAIVADRNRAQKHVARARIILAFGRPAGGRRGRQARRGRPAGGLALAAALRRGRRRRPAARQDPQAGQAAAWPTPPCSRVVALTCAEPPGEATHWTGRAMAKASRHHRLRSVQRIWQAHGLQPHRIRTFKRSNDPAFAAKLEDIVGLYLDPPNARDRAVGRREIARSRRSTAPSRACRSSRARPAP